MQCQHYALLETSEILESAGKQIARIDVMLGGGRAGSLIQHGSGRVLSAVRRQYRSSAGRICLIFSLRGGDAARGRNLWFAGGLDESRRKMVGWFSQLVCHARSK